MLTHDGRATEVTIRWLTRASGSSCRRKNGSPVRNAFKRLTGHSGRIHARQIIMLMCESALIMCGNVHPIKIHHTRRIEKARYAAERKHFSHCIIAFRPRVTRRSATHSVIELLRHAGSSRFPEQRFEIC